MKFFLRSAAIFSLVFLWTQFAVSAFYIADGILIGKKTDPSFILYADNDIMINNISNLPVNFKKEVDNFLKASSEKNGRYLKLDKQLEQFLASVGLKNFLAFKSSDSSKTDFKISKMGFVDRKGQLDDCSSTYPEHYLELNAETQDSLMGDFVVLSPAHFEVKSGFLMQMNKLKKSSKASDFVLGPKGGHELFFFKNVGDSGWQIEIKRCSTKTMKCTDYGYLEKPSCGT